MKEPVIGHMGRLVTDDRQVPMFGGSTTGVHFISQAEQQLQLLHMHKDALPSCAYGLYLHNPWGASVHSSTSPVTDGRHCILLFTSHRRSMQFRGCLARIKFQAMMLLYFTRHLFYLH
ncbi:hypothetical protein LB503_010948 [Fusarium chuoi]|nr:hypothetical protein LB503_010948 [Fusarium chuoi]